MTHRVASYKLTSLSSTGLCIAPSVALSSAPDGCIFAATSHKIQESLSRTQQGRCVEKWEWNTNLSYLEFRGAVSTIILQLVFLTHQTHGVQCQVHLLHGQLGSQLQTMGRESWKEGTSGVRHWKTQDGNRRIIRKNEKTTTKKVETKNLWQ